MYSAMKKGKKYVNNLWKVKIKQKHPRPKPIIRPIPINIPDNVILQELISQENQLIYA